MNRKGKIITVALIIAIASMFNLSTTLSYFVFSSDPIVSTFTVGDI